MMLKMMDKMMVTNDAQNDGQIKKCIFIRTSQELTQSCKVVSFFLTTGNQHWSCPVVWLSKGWSIRPVIFKGANPTFIDGLLSLSLIPHQAQPRPMSTTYGPLPENEFHDEWNTFTHPSPILVSDDDSNGIPMVSTFHDNMTDNATTLSTLNALSDNPTDGPTPTDGIDNDMDMPSATHGNDMGTSYPTHGNDMTMLSSTISFPALTYNNEEDHEKLKDLSSELYTLRWSLTCRPRAAAASAFDMQVAQVPMSPRQSSASRRTQMSSSSSPTSATQMHRSASAH